MTIHTNHTVTKLVISLWRNRWQILQKEIFNKEHDFKSLAIF